jgi:hypothetical protein
MSFTNYQWQSEQVTKQEFERRMESLKNMEQDYPPEEYPELYGYEPVDLQE